MGLRAWWDHLWFTPEPARNLAAARIVIAMHALWMLLSRDYAGVSGLPSAFWVQVRNVDRWRYLLFPGHADLERVLSWAAAASLVGLALGLTPRITALVAALLLYHLAPLETIIWTASPYERGLEVSVLALVVLAVSPCADAWSVRPRAPGGATGSAYRWPLVLVQVFVAQIYFFSGYSKLFRVGLEWISAANLRQWLLVFNQQDQLAVFTTLGPWIADRPVLAFSAAALAVLLDLGFIVTVFWRWARWVFLPTAIVFHAGIVLTMNIVFLNLPQLLVFIDWDALARRVSGGDRSFRGRLVPAPVRESGLPGPGDADRLAP